MQRQLIEIMWQLTLGPYLFLAPDIQGQVFLPIYMGQNFVFSIVMGHNIFQHCHTGSFVFRGNLGYAGLFLFLRLTVWVRGFQTLTVYRATKFFQHCRMGPQNFFSTVVRGHKIFSALSYGVIIFFQSQVIRGYQFFLA